ncbi:unnamed protein product [Lepeophtheirus salmonis]|uniref:(salmon louse) hypothetical protein n=1 Tax=Lepeophtheirus salmonis TaxID=72036 RepID=A0A0K2V7Y1_LEPSM|nr:unnamed protein product [Lepeophtheirus salmonis]CAF2865004.1 unnamed protein product [Lepeophtheirus salmonis]
MSSPSSSQTPGCSSSSGGDKHIPIRPVFSSPGQIEDGAKGSSLDNSNLELIMARHFFPDDVEKSLRAMQKEEHVKRLKNLRKSLEGLQKTQWQFTPINKLTGQ